MLSWVVHLLANRAGLVAKKTELSARLFDLLGLPAIHDPPATPSAKPEPAEFDEPCPMHAIAILQRFLT